VWWICQRQASVYFQILLLHPSLTTMTCVKYY
jgi:hypothetical protein